MGSIDFDDLEFDEDELDDLEEDYESGSAPVQNQGMLGDIASKHGLGLPANMTEDELKKFKESDEYKQFRTEVDTEHTKVANYQGKTVQEIFGLSNKKDALSYSFNAFEHFDIDIEIYKDIYDTSTVMQNTVTEGNKIYPAFEYLHQDIFLSLYKYKTKLLPETDMHLSSRLNHKFAQTYLNTPEYIKLRQTCRLDQFNAALGTEIIGQKVLEIIKEVMQQMKDLQDKIDKMNELKKAEQQMDTLIEDNKNLDELIEDMMQNGGNPSQLLAQQQANNASNQQLKELANKIAAELDTLLEDDEILNEITAKSGDAFDETAQEVSEISDLVEAWGLGEGERSRVSFDNKKDAIEKIRRSNKLSKLTDLIGRFKESAITEQKKKTKNGAVEISSVKTGKNIQDTLPSERLNLCNDVTKKDFYRRYSENQLLVYSKESNKEKNKGPIICCIDTSGSMQGKEEMWSKALGIAVLEIAQLQKRDYACILYDSRAEDPIVIKKDEIAPQKIIDIAERFSGGGTSFEAPLKKATDLIKSSAFKDADILFITDGDCYVSDDFKRKFKQLKEDKEFKTLGVLVNMGRGHTSNTSLKEFCDDIVPVSNIADLTNSESDTNKRIFGTL